MAPDMTPEEKKDLFDATGQLKGGYDMGMAQAFAIEHAKKTQGEYVGGDRQRVPLIWNIESASYDEDLECFKVVLSCHPEGIEAQQKGVWEYHVRSTGGLMPGTPLLRQSLRYTPPRLRGGRPWVWALLALVVLGLIGEGAYAALATESFPGKQIRSLLSPATTPTPGFRPTFTPVPTRPAPTATAVVRPSPAPTATRAATPVIVVLPTVPPTPLPKPTATSLPTATQARPTPTLPVLRITPVATSALRPKPTLTPMPTPTPVVSATRVTFNFNTLGTGDLGSNALVPWGIWMASGSLYASPVEPKGQIVPPGVTKVAQFLGPGFPRTVPHCTTLTFSNPASATAQVVRLTSFTITRIGTTGGGSTPAWRMRAFDAQGKQVGTDVGEGSIPNTSGFFAMPAAPQDFTVAGPGISKIEFCAHNTLSTYGSLPIAQVGYAR